MRVFLASPNNQLQAATCCGRDVLLSFGVYKPWVDDYHPTFESVLIDSGAFTEFSSGKAIDIGAYRDWSSRWRGRAMAIAGLDDIAGNWRKGLANFEAIPWSFPTFHESDPPDILDDLVAMARERNTWLGLGLLPPRAGKDQWVRDTCERIPEGVHVHGWACREFSHIGRLDSVDSTNWWRDAMKLKVNPETKHLTMAEALDVIVKRYERWTRQIESDERPEVLPFLAGGTA